MVKVVETTSSLSTQTLMRGVIALIALWSVLQGLILLGSGGDGILGVGVADRAGQRLLGAHMLLLVPAYALIAWRPERYAAFVWLPACAQAMMALVILYSVISGDTGFGDGLIACIIGAALSGTLGYLWIREQRRIASLPEPEAKPSPPAPPAARPADATSAGTPWPEDG